MPFKLNVHETKLTEGQFAHLRQENPDVRLELTAQGELVIMPPTELESGRRNTKMTQRLANWSEVDGTGIVFDSSTLFTLPNGAKRSPDGSWIQRERWDELPIKEREKMREYLANGAQQGWLIDLLEKRVSIYRPGQEGKVLDDPLTLSGDPVLSGFVLPVRELW